MIDEFIANLTILIPFSRPRTGKSRITPRQKTFLRRLLSLFWQLKCIGFEPDLITTQPLR